MRTIIIEDYQPKWAEVFKQLKTIYQQAIPLENLWVEHVGSTSVPGLAAKPILDIDLVIESLKDLPVVIKALESLGYSHEGNLGIKGREAFKRRSDCVPYTANERKWMAHHLYVCEQGSMGLENHLKLRDYLKKHPTAVEEYSQLKRELAKKYPYNIDRYIQEKTPLILKFLRKAGIKASVLEDIANQNSIDEKISE